MLDTVSIISDSGVLLWQATNHETGRRAIVNQLIQEVLLEDRAGLTQYGVGDYQVRWALANEAKFFVVAVYPKFFKPHYIQSFLRDVLSSFMSKYGKQTVRQDFYSSLPRADHHKFEMCSAGISTNLFNFDKEYEVLLAKFNASEAAALNQETRKLLNHNGDESEEQDCGEEMGNDGAGSSLLTPREPVDSEGDGDGAAYTKADTQHTGKVIVTKDGRRLQIGGSSAAKQQKSGDTATSNTNSANQASSKRKKKQPTKWDSPGAVYDPAVEVQLRDKRPTAEELQAQASIQKETYIKRLPNGSVAPLKEKEWEGQSRSRLATWLRSYVGSREVDSEDLRNIIPNLREKLIAKNVAVGVAEHVCESVEASISGKRLGTFDSLYNAVESAMVASLRRILQPKREVNILRDVAAVRAAKRPYSIVLCGVNGVGKSTSLAKISYWLQQNGCSLLIAAGDTFRHGAVEQLEVHGRCLGVSVFQMGYGADPSAVAAAAISQAARQQKDVVMIDTAGRMQDHESRMRALAKLINDNQPDLILFVGEALVGNNGVDQLRKFNQCLVDFAPVGSRCRGIDGIVLTKFDTIDDKVGAALSMVYELGQPIVFVGVGQTYQDLKVIEPEVVVSALMK